MTKRISSWVTVAMVTVCVGRAAPPADAVDSVPVIVPYTTESISINGVLSEWTMAVQISWQGSISDGESDNPTTVRLLWDQKRLYVAFAVTDTDLRGNRVRNEQELWFDDAVEVLLDTKADAYRTVRMSEDTFLGRGGQYWGEKQVFLDENDYHVVVNIVGSHLLAHGNGLSYEGVAVSKDVSAAVRCMGTVNDGRDTDDGFVVEMALPWESLKVKPHNGLRMGAEFGIEDIDGGERTTSSWLNLRPFAQPHLWGAIELRGAPEPVAASRQFLVWVLGGLILAGLVGLAWAMKSRKQMAADEGGSDIARARARGAANTIDAYIREHYASTDACIGDAARRLSMSPRRLQMMLKQAGKPSFRQQLASYRFEKAEELLRTSTRTVSEIAFDVGFNSPAVFSAAYRKHTGHSPSGLRRDGERS